VTEFSKEYRVINGIESLAEIKGDPSEGFVSVERQGYSIN
jgi:hypothetical protein